MVWGHFRLPPDTGAGVVTRLEAETDRVWREARAAGRRASRERYAAEALVRVVTGAADDGTGGGEAGGEVHEVDGAGGPAPVSTGRHAPAAGAGELLLMVDLAAWRRGAVEGDEICTIAGFGDVPVEVPRRLLDEGGFLTLVLREGTRVHAVHRVGRRIPAALRSALVAEAVLADGEIRCATPGCDRTRVEWDHVTPVAESGLTEMTNLQPLCIAHHRIKSRAQTPLPTSKRRARAGPDPP